MEQRQVQDKPWVASGKAATLPHGKERGEVFTLCAPDREQETAVLLLIFRSWQRTLTPGWVTGFIILRKIELICSLDFNLSLLFLFVQFQEFYYSVLTIISENFGRGG